MDIVSPAPWSCEPATEDPLLFHEFEMNSFGDEFYAEDIATMLEGFHPHQSLPLESNSSSSLTDLAPTTFPLPTTTTTITTSAMQVMKEIRPMKQPELGNHSAMITENTSLTNESSSSPMAFNFDSNAILSKDSNRSSLGTNNHQKEDASSSSDLDPWSGVVVPHGSALDVNQEPQSKDPQTRKRRASRPPAHSRDHIMAERKRREKISERFIALSALVPGLKKTDKTSVLGEAIKCMKKLQERLKTLEEEAAKRAVESVVIVKKSEVMVDDGTDCCSNGDFHSQLLPEIEAKFSDRNVLLKIHCEKQKGGVVKVLSEIEKLHLSIVNVHATPFIDTTQDITVVAQMDKVFDTAPQAVIRGLRSALRHI